MARKMRGSRKGGGKGAMRTPFKAPFPVKRAMGRLTKSR
jgi:hypothetical protein